MARTAFVLLLSIVAACAASETIPASDSAEIATLVRARLAAALAGDTAAWHAQVSDSCVFTGAELRVSLTKDVIGSIAANRTLNPKVQRIDKLVVHVVSGVAQATYVQLVQDNGQPEREGKRFRKTDTYVGSGDSWKLIGAAEVPIPFRAALVLPPDPATQPAGRYTLGADTLTLASAGVERFTLVGTDGVMDTLLIENDSTLYVDGDSGSWIVRGTMAQTGVLIYRSKGAADIVLTRVRP